MKKNHVSPEPVIRAGLQELDTVDRDENDSATPTSGFLAMPFLFALSGCSIEWTMSMLFQFWTCCKIGS